MACCKKISILFIIFIVFFYNFAFATDEIVVKNISNVDAYNFLRDQYEINWNRFIQRNITIAINNNNTFNADFIEQMNAILNGGYQRVWYIDSINCTSFFFNSNGTTPILSNSDTNTLMFGTCNFSNESQRIEDFFTLNPSYASIMNSSRRSRIYNYTNNATILRYDNNGITKYTNNKISIPEGLERYIPDYYYDTLRSIINGTFSFQSVNELLADIDDKINEINNYLQDDTISNYTTDDLPSDDSTDITRDFFNSTFTNLYNKFTYPLSTNQSITIPYINYTFNLNSNVVQNALYTSGNSELLTFISATWYFSISLYIIKDIYRYINDLKNGNVAKTEENIKTTML